MARSRVTKVVPSGAVDIGAGVVKNIPGNHFDKHGSGNALIQRLMDRFHEAVIDAVRSLPHESILDAGCGEGRTTRILADATGSTMVGVELESSVLVEGPSNAPSAMFTVGSVYELPFDDSSFDVVVATEVLEHLDSPPAALAELIRVARSGVVITVPYEPWWRLGNVIRGRYLRDLGNTPGHVQHWTKTQLVEVLSAHGRSSTVTTVLPWNLGVIRK